VVTSWYQEAKEFKSPAHVVAAFLLRSRETQRAINERLQEEVAELKEQLKQRAQKEQRQQQEIDALRQQVNDLHQELQEAKRSVNLPEDPPIGTHGYGARMIALATNLAGTIGFRGATRVLRLFFEWLGVDQNTPTRTAIRNWLQRLGIAELQQPLGPNEELVIMVDHSMQIGTEKIMVALGVSASELRDGAKGLKKRRNDTIVLRDFRHYAANVLKSILGKDDRFQAVGGKIGKTRSAIQQTELAHLTPPSPKQKARFMNLGSKIRWMTMIVWLLKNPDATARQKISDERLEEKLGWVREYGDDIRVWQECQNVVSRSLTFINEQYLFQGAADGLRGVIGDSLEHDKSQELANRLIDFVRDAEQQLHAGERLPLSTEILESTFGLYKQLERQQSKSGFTSLLACLPGLLKPTTVDGVRTAFERVSAGDVKTWVKKHFDSTVTSRRNAAYAEHKAALKNATPQQALT